jgi:hypothetical protein
MREIGDNKQGSETAFVGTIRRANPEFESVRGRFHHSLHSEDSEDAFDLPYLIVVKSISNSKITF